MRKPGLPSYLFPLFALLMAACTPVFGSTPAPRPEGEAPAQRPAYVLPPDTHVFELKNGIKLVVYENHAAEIVAMDTWVGVGSADETEENNGVSHFLEHLLFKGTEKWGPGELDQTLASLGAQFNAATSDDYTHYYIQVASRHFEKALEIHADMLLNAAIPAEELRAERQVVIEEINRANDMPIRTLFDEMQEMLYDRHPYRMSTLGPPENIRDLPREEILGYYRKWYVPSNMTVVISGDVEPDKARELVEKYFGQAPAAEAPKARPPLGPVPEQALERTLEEEVQAAYLAIAFRGPEASDIGDTLALDAGALVLGQGRSSRLYQRLVEREQLAFQVSSSLWSKQQSGLFYVFAVCDPRKVEQVRAAILDEIRALSRQPMPLEELEKARVSLERDFVYEAESTLGMAGLYGYFDTVADLRDVFRYRDEISRLTPQRVLEAIRRHLRTERSATVRLLPKGFDPAQMLPVAAVTTDAAQAGTDVARGGSEVVKTELPNGATLLVKHNPQSRLVSFVGLLDGGDREAPRAGLTDLTARVVMKGTGTRTAEELAREIERNGLGLSVSSSVDFIRLDGSGLKGDLPYLLVLLKDVFYNATFPQEQIDHERKRLLEEIRRSREQPSAVASEHARMSLFPGHPYGNVGARVEKALPEISREELLHYYRAQFRPERLVIAVAGDVNPEAVAAMVTELFPPRKDMPQQDVLEPAKDAEGPAETLYVRTPVPTEQTFVVRSFLAPAISSEDYAALKVAASLLGHGLSSRLFIELREKRGLAYSTGASYSSRFDPSGFDLYIGTDPQNTKAVIGGFEAQLARLREELVPNEELEKAKQQFIGAFMLSHERSLSQAWYLAFYELSGRGFIFDETYPEQIEAVTAEKVREVARKYLSGPSVISIAGPEKFIDPDADLKSWEEIPVTERTERPSARPTPQTPGPVRP